MTLWERRWTSAETTPGSPRDLFQSTGTAWVRAQFIRTAGNLLVLSKRLLPLGLNQRPRRRRRRGTNPHLQFGKNIAATVAADRERPKETPVTMPEMVGAAVGAASTEGTNILTSGKLLAPQDDGISSYLRTTGMELVRRCRCSSSSSSSHRRHDGNGTSASSSAENAAAGVVWVTKQTSKRLSKAVKRSGRREQKPSPPERQLLGERRLGEALSAGETAQSKGGHPRFPRP